MHSEPPQIYTICAANFKVYTQKVDTYYHKCILDMEQSECTIGCYNLIDLKNGKIQKFFRQGS